MVFDAVDQQRFYVYSHPQALCARSARGLTTSSAAATHQPFADKPELGEQLKAQLRR